MSERERLIARIRQIRRTAAAAAGDPADPRTAVPDHDVISALEARVTHLEHQLQGLQDSVHREARRQGKRIADLETQIEPGELGRALSRDARERGT